MPNRKILALIDMLIIVIILGSLAALAVSKITAGASCAELTASSAGIDDKIWPLVAKSHVIVTGILNVPVDTIKSNLSSNKHNYVELNITPDLVLKGNLTTPFSVRWFTEPRDYLPSPEHVISLNGKKVLLFLIYVDNAPVNGLYFAGYTPQALSLPESGLIDRIRREVAVQQKILKYFKEEFPPSKEPLYTKVKQLIDKTTKKDTQMAAFTELENLGPNSVPAIIMLMDDRRDLAVPEISLENPPDNWEGIRHYGPKKIVDAMDAILNQITNESFGNIHNSGSERERVEAVNGWRIYLYYLDKKKHTTNN